MSRTRKGPAAPWDNRVIRLCIWLGLPRRLFSAGGLDYLPDRVGHQLRLFDLHVVAALGANPVRRVGEKLSKLVLTLGPGLLQRRRQPVGEARRKRKGLALRDHDERDGVERRRFGGGAHLIETHIEVDGL